MSGTDGVRIDHLVCPTCQEMYRLPLEVMVNNAEEDFDVNLQVGPIRSRPANWMYCIVCPNGHQWSIKQVTRRLNHPDELLLDRYIGDL